MGTCRFFMFLILTLSLFVFSNSQLQVSQAQVLLQLKKHLQYPKQLDIWYDHRTNFCSLPPSPQLNVTCYENSVTELQIKGDYVSRVTDFTGFSVPNETLSDTFSIDSFVTTLSRLSNLKVLSLVSLGIWGPLPDKIHRLSSLESIDLSSNFLFGAVPHKLSTMVKLQNLVLDDNFFNETIPGWFDSYSNLTNLSVKNNKLIGPFPKSIADIRTLTKLDLSKNEISGNLPALLFALPKLTSLNLASNSLTGSLPNDLTCAGSLVFVDISENRLTGKLPSCLRTTETETKVVNLGGNCLSINRQDQKAESYCESQAVADEHHHDPIGKGKVKGEGKGKGIGIGALVILVVGVVALVAILGFGFLIGCRRFCKREISEQHLLHKVVQDSSAAGLSSDVLTNARFISDTAKLGSHGFPACRSFALEEITEATKNFNASNIMSESSNGMLYKGRLTNGTEVVIRCLPPSKKYSIRNLKLRLDLLAKLRHPHLVCLFGHCIDGGGRDDYSINKVYLIYEYVPNGNFHTCLSEVSSARALKWTERLRILIGVAKAVHFLHTGVIPGFFNNKLKANNILLDEHLLPKLSDYGLSIVKEETTEQEAKGGSQKSWKMTTLEDDIYSFGFIMLESLLKPSASAKTEAFLRDELAYLDSQEGRRMKVDHTVLANSSNESLSLVISLVNKCVTEESTSRPSFEDILWNLQYAAQVQAIADGE